MLSKSSKWNEALKVFEYIIVVTKVNAIIVAKKNFFGMPAIIGKIQAPVFAIANPVSCISLSIPYVTFSVIRLTENLLGIRIRIYKVRVLDYS